MTGCKKESETTYKSKIKLCKNACGWTLIIKITSEICCKKEQTKTKYFPESIVYFKYI